MYDWVIYFYSVLSWLFYPLSNSVLFMLDLGLFLGLFSLRFPSEFSYYLQFYYSLNFLIIYYSFSIILFYFFSGDLDATSFSILTETL